MLKTVLLELRKLRTLNELDMGIFHNILVNISNEVAKILYEMSER